MQLQKPLRSCSNKQCSRAVIPAFQIRWRSRTIGDVKCESNVDTAAITSRRTFLELFAAPAFISALQQLAIPQVATAARGLAAPDAATYKAVRSALKRAFGKGKAPVMLRLVFHDAGTYSATTHDGGLNASIRFELDRPENFGLKRGWKVIDQLASSLKGTAAERLSYADLIALAGAYAVEITGGPIIPVPIGRPDASSADPEGMMPAETLTSEQLKASFAAKGLSSQQLVALSGAHTIGGKGFGDGEKFDNAYYTALLQKPWLDTKNEMASMIGLPSDHVLPEDAELLPYIQQYAQDQAAFFRDFSDAYLVMCSLGM